MESARLAVEADVSVIEAIAERHRESIVGQRGADLFLRREAGTGPVGARVRDAIGGDGNLAIAGCYDDVVFGYGLIEMTPVSDGDLLARLTDFVVDQEIRGSGIGEAMMNLVVSLAEERGCLGIDAMALPGDRETKNFFESFGLKARLLTVHRALEQRPGESG